MKPESVDKVVDAGTFTGSVFLTLGCMLWFIPLIVIVIGLFISLFQ